MRIARTGFTLVELLVVITIIGILMSLLLPAVQSTREAARRTQCSNHLKQIGLGSISHASQQGHYPSSGWGWGWVGDPDRGFGLNQPGGWIYNLLPYIEQSALHDLGAGKSAAQKMADAATVTATPINIMNCPTRRRAITYREGTHAGFNAVNANVVPAHARSDYAINSGHTPSAYYGPNSYAEGDNPAYGWAYADPTADKGLSFQHLLIKPDMVKDGTTNTVLVAEKYLTPTNYDNGQDGADNLSMYQGYDWDVCRWGNVDNLPRQDRIGDLSWFAFGSAHNGGCQFVFCDGSVRVINYSIDGATYHRLCNRKDGEVIDFAGF
jgi:prepilin-type N-terminal cleavage/methylation domain-containing protein/prepilin-type processing-associated H-X9-DG protein